MLGFINIILYYVFNFILSSSSSHATTLFLSLSLTPLPQLVVHHDGERSSMNSLTYLSRQFDVLASVKTPPSTPTVEYPPPQLLEPVHPPLRRALSFLYPSSYRPSSRSSSRRPHSSPAFQPQPLSPQSSSNSSSPPAAASQSSASQSATLHEPLLTPQRSKPRHQLDTVINQVFLIRLFLLVWNNLKSGLSAFLEQLNLYVWPRLHPVPIGSLISEKGKEKEIQVIEEIVPSMVYYDSKLESQLASRESTSSPEGTPAPPSRASTPLMNDRKSRFGQKTLVLDLDETLIHSTSRPNPSLASSGSGFLGLGSMGRRNKSPGHTVEVILGGRRTQYHVYKRPFADFFLRTVSYSVCQNHDYSESCFPRFLDGILWLYSPHLCKSMRIQSLTGWMLDEGFLSSVSSETYVPLSVPTISLPQY